MKGKRYLKQKLLQDTFVVKRYGKGLLAQIKEEEVYKMITIKAFTEDEDSTFKKIKPHKKQRPGRIHKRRNNRNVT